MRFGLVAANIGSYADPRTVVRLAEAAEEAGWEALLLWDHLAWVWDGPAADPWVTLAAVATRTERLRLGTAVTPVPRRRPQVLAAQVATLDELSGGRALLGAGLGGNRREFEEFGESFELERRWRLLDEGLELMRGLWAGPLGPRQVPVWIGGDSEGALRRAAAHDGWIPNSTTLDRLTISPGDLARRLAGVEPRDVAVMGYSRAGEHELHAGYEHAGATWWLESVHDVRAPFEEVLARVAAGP